LIDLEVDLEVAGEVEIDLKVDLEREARQGSTLRSIKRHKSNDRGLCGVAEGIIVSGFGGDGRHKCSRRRGHMAVRPTRRR
jgi:hypothetical protein